MWVCVSACGYGGGGEGERKSGHLQDRDRVTSGAFIKEESRFHS